MGLLKNVDVRVTGLNNTTDHLANKHLEHERTHQRYKEQTTETMNDMNEKILEIRQLCGFSNRRDSAVRGTPDGEEDGTPTEKLTKAAKRKNLAKLLANKWMSVSKKSNIDEELVEDKMKEIN